MSKNAPLAKQELKWRKVNNENERPFSELNLNKPYAKDNTSEQD
jgi:hypothetical protein